MPKDSDDQSPLGVGPAGSILRALSDFSLSAEKPPAGNRLLSGARMIRDAIAGWASEDKDGAGSAADARACDTVMVFSDPDEASIFENAFRGMFQPEFDYYAAIKEPADRRRIDSMARRSHKLVAQLPFEGFRNAIAWSWVKLRQDVAEIARQNRMNKLGRGCALLPEFTVEHIVLAWTFNGSMLLLTPGDGGIDLVYEAISLRPRYLTDVPSSELEHSARFHHVKVNRPIELLGVIDTSAIISSKIRAVYWARHQSSHRSRSIEGEVADAASAFGQRSSKILRLIKSDKS
ncbi:MAG: hypothetical protein HYV63_28960 [Candidatus Schekmanbacteria bacterium]|nr:hypothetical protein [Candidatus Schekmanbacteria bacterium]